MVEIKTKLVHTSGGTDVTGLLILRPVYHETADKGIKQKRISIILLRTLKTYGEFLITLKYFAFWLIISF